jgi:hypothetical protein
VIGDAPEFRPGAGLVPARSPAGQCAPAAGRRRVPSLPPPVCEQAPQAAAAIGIESHSRAIARFTALTTASSVAVTMLECLPTP